MCTFRKICLSALPVRDIIGKTEWNGEMMQYDVMITVRGEQEYESGERDHTDLTADGVLADTPEGWTLCYDQTAENEQTHTVLAIGAQRVVLRRSGTLRSEMVFEVGKTHTTVYELPFGALSMEVSTDSIRQKLSERGGLLEIRYRITVGGQMKSRNSFRMQIKRKM